MGKDIAIRHGSCIVYCKTVEQAVQFSTELRVHNGEASVETGGGERLTELASFAESYDEIAKRVGGRRMLRSMLPAALANDARDLVRARGSASHPVVAGRCQRVLEEVQQAVLSTGPPRGLPRREETAQSSDDDSLSCVDRLLDILAPESPTIPAATPKDRSTDIAPKLVFHCG